MESGPPVNPVRPERRGGDGEAADGARPVVEAIDRPDKPLDRVEHVPCDAGKLDLAPGLGESQDSWPGTGHPAQDNLRGLSPPVRVLHVVPMVSPHVGGMVTAAVETAAACRTLGIEPTIVATDAKHPPQGPERGRIALEELPEEWREAGEIITYPACPPYRLANGRGMRRGIASHVAGADVVHIHSLFMLPHLHAFRACRAQDKPYVVSLHGALDPYIRERGRVRKRVVAATWGDAMLNGAEAIHVTTEDERAATADVAPGVPRDVIPVGVRTEDFSGGDGVGFRDRRLGGWAGDVILFLGRITEKKKVDHLLRGFAAADAANARLVVAGPDSNHLSEGFEKLAADLGIADRVVFPGALFGEDRRDALAAAQVWALTSATENFGIAVIEAVAAGIPVLISEGVNLAPWVREYEVGYVCSLEIESIAQGINDLLDNPPSPAGRAAALAEMKWEAVAPAYADMYRRLAG